MYYVYLLIDPRNNSPFYVGKGKGKRAQYHIYQNQKGKNTENPFKDNVIRQILREGLVPLIEYVFHHSDESIAYSFETDLIKKYGRRRYDDNGILTNLCEDSRPPHLEYSQERKELYRKRMLGNTLNTGRVQSDEEKEKRSAALKRSYETGKRIVTDKMRQATKQTHLGKVVSEKTKSLQSVAAKKNNAWKAGKTYEEIFGIEKANEIREKKKKLLPPNRKEITIDGITYQSIKQAALALGKSEYKVKKLYDNTKI